MALVKNISNGPRGAYVVTVTKDAEGKEVKDCKLVIAEVGEVIEADDFPEEWFEEVDAKSKAKPAGKAAAAE